MREKIFFFSNYEMRYIRKKEIGKNKIVRGYQKELIKEFG